jgi:hypothetical protein
MSYSTMPGAEGCEPGSGNRRRVYPQPFISSGPEDLESLFDLFLDLCKSPELTTSVRQLAEARLDTFKHFQPPPRPKKVRDFSNLEMCGLWSFGKAGNIGLTSPGMPS